MGDGRKSQKELHGRNLSGWLAVDENRDGETLRGKWIYRKTMGLDTEFEVEM